MNNHLFDLHVSTLPSFNRDKYLLSYFLTYRLDKLKGRCLKFTLFITYQLKDITLANKNQLSGNLVILALILTSMSESARCSRVPVWSEDGHRLQNQASIRRQFLQSPVQSAVNLSKLCCLISHMSTHPDVLW